MLAHISAFWVPKRGSTPDEYEDAFWTGPGGDSQGEIRAQRLRVAIADGASESLLASRWAKRLVEVFATTGTATHTRAGFMAAYRHAASGWDEQVRSYIAEREGRGLPIEWYEEPGLAKGAYATVLAVEFREPVNDQTPGWTASCIGDSCIFQVRDESVYASFPMNDASAFSFQPPLLASRNVDHSAVRRHIALQVSDFERGDSFYLATDALAAWFLRGVEAGNRPWEPLRDMDTLDAELDFVEWVDNLRDIGAIHNDDTTLIRLDIC
jgi:hypothetical protein